MKILGCVACIFINVLAAVAQDAATTQPDTEEPAATESTGESTAGSSKDILSRDRLTGDWGGSRTWLEEHGLTLDLGLTSIYQHNARGGKRTLHRVSGSYDLEMTFDFDALKIWKGGKLYALTEGAWDKGISEAGYVGDLFGVNADDWGDDWMDLTELWYEQSFLDNRLRVRFGKINLFSDFDTNAFANDQTSQFLNNALTYTANVPFPNTGHGIQFVATPFDWCYFGAGVADAAGGRGTTGFHTAYHGPADFFSIYEFGLTPTFESGWGRLPGHYRFGLWYDPQPKAKFFDDLDGRRRTVPMKRDDVGCYLNFDQLILRENPQTDGDEQGLGAFFRYGFAHGDVNEIENFWSVGGQYQGAIPTRDDDVIGFGVAQGILSKQMRLAGADPHRETALELYYNASIFPWLSISPDFQWILCPGGENGRDAFVAGVRLQATF